MATKAWGKALVRFSVISCYAGMMGESWALYDRVREIARKLLFEAKRDSWMKAVLFMAVDLPGRDGTRLLLHQGCGLGQKLCHIWVESAFRSLLQEWVAQRFRFHP